MKSLRTLSALLAVLAAGPAWGKVGLAARFGDLILENVQIGRTYNLREAARVPLGIENKSDVEAEIIVRSEIPMKSSLSKDYEPVPDPDWLKALPERMRIGAHQVGYFDLLLTVPDDPALVGKHYQVMVKAETSGVGMLNVAIENKLRFSIGPGPESVAAEKKKKAMQQLDFDVSPQTLTLRDVPVGKAYDVRKEAKKSVRVSNFSQEPLTVTLSSEKWDGRFGLPSGYEAIPDPGWIKVKESTVTVAGEAIGIANLVIAVPDDAKWKDRKFAGMIRTGLATGFWLDAPVKVLVETRK